jgi:hypothetical protein
MLTPGNGHLGPLFHGFTIPARITCPGATRSCLLVCYALDFLFLYVKQNRLKYEANLARAQDTDRFAADMIAEIRWKLVKFLRIHVGGDFFSIAYIRAWIRIARSCKRTTFLFYTRSWRVPEFRPALIELAALPNVCAFWSEDRDSGPSNFPVGRRCFLMIEPADATLVPPGVLVFRHHTRLPAKWIHGSWVCPKEQGTHSTVTCSTCQRCLTPMPWPVPPHKGRRGPDGLA